MPDRLLVERIAEELGTSPGLVEKDWHVVRALAVIAGVGPAGMVPAFSGGTPLLKGWGGRIGSAQGRRESVSRARDRSARTAVRKTIGEAKAGNYIRLSI